MADTRMIAFTPRRLCLLNVLLSLLLLASSCSSKPSDPQPPPQGARQMSEPSGGARPVAEEADDGQWPMPAKNYASTRFSGLDQINTDNVKNLKVAWTFSTGRQPRAGGGAARRRRHDVRRHAVPEHPLRARPDEARRAAKWKYEPKPAPAAQGVACCDVVNRGAAYADGKVFFNTLDGHTVAVDAETGKEVWKTQARRHQQGRDDHDGAARRQGQGARRQQRRRVRRARLARRRSTPTTGKIVWRAYSTGPGRRRADRPATSSRSTRRIGARTSASTPGRRTRGRSAAARSGAGSPTTRS